MSNSAWLVVAGNLFGFVTGLIIFKAFDAIREHRRMKKYRKAVAETYERQCEQLSTETDVESIYRRYWEKILK